MQWTDPYSKHNHSRNSGRECGKCVFSWNLGLRIVDTNPFLGGEGSGGGLVILPIYNEEALAEKCQSGGKSVSHHPFPA